MRAFGRCERVSRRKHAAVVLGMFETGLGVARSLGRQGIRVIGVDKRRDVGFASKFVEPSFCPDPLDAGDAFIEHLLRIASEQDQKPVLFVTSDDYLPSLAQHRTRLEKALLLNIPPSETLESISDKYGQYELARRAGVAVPATFALKGAADVKELREKIPFPVFVKARDVTAWRRIVGGNVKGFVAQTPKELETRLEALADRGLEALVQELIPGPDSNVYMACCYVSQAGELIRAFALRKLRQQPPGFGFGSLAVSVRDEAVLSLGRRYLESMDYRGIGAIELKQDERDGQLKLIELNARYWQQNALADRCEMSFPLAQYQDLTGETPTAASGYDVNVKWLNALADFDSFRVYRRRGTLDFATWIRSLRGPKVYSNFATDDPMPGVRAVTNNIAARRPLRALLKSIRRTSERRG